MTTYLVAPKGTNLTETVLAGIARAGAACDHCDADYSVGDRDRDGIPHIAIRHDDDCPVLAAHRPDLARPNRAQRRAHRKGKR